jgi:hypothetical protein
MADSKTLEARRKAREKVVEIGGHAYTIRRPKPAEMLENMTRIELVRRFTVGWDLTNADLVPGGDPEPEPFVADLFADYVDDMPELWGPLSEAIQAEWSAYLEMKATVTKN